MISEANLHAAVAAIDFFCVGEVVMVLPTQLTMERHSNFTIKLFDRFQKKEAPCFRFFMVKKLLELSELRIRTQFQGQSTYDSNIHQLILEEFF